jgi:hypothetical protein
MSAFTKTQASGTGLALVSTFAPTLGFEVPYLLRLGGVVIGVVMLIWPAITFAWDHFQVRQMSLALKMFLVCCSIPVASIWGMAWWIVPAKTAVVVAPPQAATPTPVPAKPKLKSTFGQMQFKCSPPDETDPKKNEKNREEYRRYIKIFGDTFGLTIKMTDVLGGDRVEMTPLTAAGKRYMGQVTKATLEVRRFSDTEILGIYTAEFGDLLFPQIWASNPVEPGSESETNARKSIERLAGAEKGGCTIR